MFRLSPDDRISSWANLRAQLENCEDPLQMVVDFWSDAPYIPYNHHVDQYNRPSWPTPWEIIVENKYDDFTRALMIGHSLKFTERFKNSVIKIHCLVDKSVSACYNVVDVGGEWVLNYKDNEPVPSENIPDSFLVENIVVL